MRWVCWFCFNIKQGNLRNHQLTSKDAKLPARSYDFNTVVESIDKLFPNKALNSQLCVDNIYIQALNRNPLYKVDSTRFLPELFIALNDQFQLYKTARDTLLDLKIPLDYKQVDIDVKTMNNTNKDLKHVASLSVKRMADIEKHRNSLALAIKNLEALLEALLELINNLPHIKKVITNDEKIPTLTAFIAPNVHESKIINFCCIVFAA